MAEKEGTQSVVVRNRVKVGDRAKGSGKQEGEESVSGIG